jgi:prophage DNA circulation protein
MFEKLRQASFKGVPFLVDTTSTGGGRKTATHEYINQGQRYVEDLGRLRKTFNITGFITEPNYILKRDALILALETEGLAPLVHPTLGIYNVVPKPYTLTEDMTSINIATFELVFEEAQLPIYPIDSGNSISKLIDSIDSVLDGVQDYIGSSFELIYSNVANLADIIFKIDYTVSAFQSAVESSGTGYTSTVNDFSATLNDLQTNQIQKVYNPTALADSFRSIGNQTANLAPSAISNFDLNKKLFHFGENDISFVADTASLIERQSNRDILNAAINIMCLTNAYLNAVQLNYETLTDLKNIQKVLEDQFNYILSLQNLPEETLEILKEIRIYAMAYFEKERLVVYKISNVNVNMTTMRELTYRYYGNLDNYDELIALNNTLNPSYIEGDVLVLTL